VHGEDLGETVRPAAVAGELGSVVEAFGLAVTDGDVALVVHGTHLVGTLFC
jgi:hypothetical protein